MALKIDSSNLDGITGGAGIAKDYCVTIQPYIGSAAQAVTTYGYYADQATATAAGKAAAKDKLAANAGFTVVKWTVSHRENGRSVIVDQGQESK